MNNEILLTLNLMEDSMLLNENALDALDWPRQIQLMINTPFGHGARGDGYELRLAGVRHGVTYATTIAAAQALAAAMEAVRDDDLGVVSLQEL